MTSTTPSRSSTRSVVRPAASAVRCASVSRLRTPPRAAAADKERPTTNSTTRRPNSVRSDARERHRGGERRAPHARPPPAARADVWGSTDERRRARHANAAKPRARHEYDTHTTPRGACELTLGIGRVARRARDHSAGAGGARRLVDGGSECVEASCIRSLHGAWSESCHERFPESLPLARPRRPTVSSVMRTHTHTHTHTHTAERGRDHDRDDGVCLRTRRDRDEESDDRDDDAPQAGGRIDQQQRPADTPTVGRDIHGAVNLADDDEPRPSAGGDDDDHVAVGGGGGSPQSSVSCDARRRTNSGRRGAPPPLACAPVGRGARASIRRRWIRLHECFFLVRST